MNEAKHASAPPGYKCSDCTMDDEPCPRCYTAWWQARHPDTCMVSVGDSELNALRAELAAVKQDAERFVWWFTVENDVRTRQLTQQQIDRAVDGEILSLADWRAAIDAARAQAGDSPPPDNWHEPADGRRLAEHNKDK